MPKHVEQNAVLKRALWLASAKVDDLSNPGHPCPNPEHCCDVQAIADRFIREAECSLDTPYGEKTYAEDLAELRALTAQ